MTTGALAKRDSYLDGWRGLFHIVMLLDHLPFLFPGLFFYIAYFFEPLGYVSVTEGFVYLSGYVTGLVYTRYLQEKGAVATWRKAIARALTIYVTYVAGVVSLLLVARLGLPSSIELGGWNYLLSESFQSAFVKTVTLVWQPSFLDILPMYALFLLLSPLAIRQLELNRRWLVIVLSIAIWTAEQFGFRNHLLVMVGLTGTVYFGFFSSPAWQVLFVIGLICGHRSYTSHGPWLPRDWRLASFVYLTALCLFAFRHGLLMPAINPKLEDRMSLGPIRLLNFICLALLAARFRKYIAPCFGWKGFAFLSRNSLQVFAFHLIPIYGAALLLKEKTKLAWWAQLLFIVSGLLGLFCIAWLSELIRGWSRKSKSVPVVSVQVESV